MGFINQLITEGHHIVDIGMLNEHLLAESHLNRSFIFRKMDVRTFCRICMSHYESMAMASALLPWHKPANILCG